MFNEFLPDTQKIGRGVIVNQTGWEQVLESNKQAFASEFVQRAQFTSAYPTSMSPTQFVDALFATAGVMPSDKRVPVSPQSAIKCYPCRQVSLNYSESLLFHGGDRGSTPVRDANS